MRWRKISIFQMLNVILMLFLIVITLYPLIYVILASFSDGAALLAHEGFILKIVGKANVTGYRIILHNKNVTRGLLNSFGYVFFGTLLNLLLTSTLAYALSRKHFHIRRFVMKAITITMFFSGGIIPLFLVIKMLNLYDSPLAVILPGAISAYNVIIMRTFFDGIPASLEESAQLDGANDFIIYSRVIMPMSGAVIAVIALYYAVGHWNAWFNAMVFLRTRKYFPLQLFLREILIENTMDQKSEYAMDFEQRTNLEDLIKYATIVVSTVPILIVYPFVQRYFVKGVMVGAVKG